MLMPYSTCYGRNCRCALLLPSTHCPSLQRNRHGHVYCYHARVPQLRFSLLCAALPCLCRAPSIVCVRATPPCGHPCLLSPVHRAPLVLRQNMAMALLLSGPTVSCAASLSSVSHSALPWPVRCRHRRSRLLPIRRVPAQSVLDRHLSMLTSQRDSHLACERALLTGAEEPPYWHRASPPIHRR